LYVLDACFNCSEIGRISDTSIIGCVKISSGKFITLCVSGGFHDIVDRGSHLRGYDAMPLVLVTSILENFAACCFKAVIGENVVGLSVCIMQGRSRLGLLSQKEDRSLLDA
jgi:hypothetical protein